MSKHNDNEMLNDKLIRKALSEIGNRLHLAPEFILADVQGELSADGHAKVQKHIKDCQECLTLYQMIKDYIEAEKETDLEEAKDGKVNIPLPESLMKKFELRNLINKDKEKIVAQTAKLFLAEESWFIIKPALKAIKNSHKNNVQLDYRGDNEELSVAAFSSGLRDKDKQELGLIANVYLFISILCELIVEKRSTFEEAKSSLAIDIQNASTQVDQICLDDDKISSIRDIIIEQLEV